MLNPFAEAETNLGRSGLLLALVVLGTATLSLILETVGADPLWGMLFGVVGFPFVAWFMSRAAQAQGRSAWLYGLVSLVPPLAIFAFFDLYHRDVDARSRS